MQKHTAIWSVDPAALKSFIRHISVPACWATFIFFMHSIPGLDITYDDPWQLVKFDKLAHMGMFAVLVLTIMVAFRKQGYSRTLRNHARKMAMLMSITYGGILEYFQGSLFPQRVTDPMDFVANTLGVFLGIVLFRIVYGRELSRSL